MAISNTCTCGGTADKPSPECERCRLVYFFRAAVRMRVAQRAFFGGAKGVGVDRLEAARQAERHVDKLIARLDELQPELFGGEDED